MDPSYESSSFYQIVTADASAAGGATDYCKTNFRAALPQIAALSSTVSGRALLSEAFDTCEPLATESEASGLVGWVQAPWATMAMGNYPYSSSYLMHGMSFLPPWPVRQVKFYFFSPKTSTWVESCYAKHRFACPPTGPWFQRLVNHWMRLFLPNRI